MAKETIKQSKELLDIHNKVSAVELEDILKTNVKAVLDNPELASKLPPICIHGSPGIGKSTVVKCVAKELGIEFIDCRLSQMEPCDIRGLPVPNKEKQQMDWFVNGTWPRDKDSKGILFLDEITACDKSIAVAAYELILDRRLGKLYSVPDGWVIVSAGNLSTDRAVAGVMPSALANRFMHLELEANAEEWVRWAQFNDVHPSVIGFVNYRPEYLFNMEGENLDRGWPSPRSWERVSHILNLYTKSGKWDENLIRKLVYGLVGNRAGVEFMEFFKINSQFDNVLEWMTNPNAKIEIPERPDAKYALVSSMNYLLWRGKDKDDETNRINGFYRICIALPSDFASMAMMAAMSGNKKELKDYYCTTLFKHKMYKEWISKHGKALHKKIKF